MEVQDGEVVYKPVDLGKFFTEIVDDGLKSAHPNLFYGQLLVEGIYGKGDDRMYGHNYYDRLIDDTGSSVTVIVHENMRRKLEFGRFTRFRVSLDLKYQRCAISLNFTVHEVCGLQETVLDLAQAQREQARLLKLQQGSKNVEYLLESILLKKERPRIALAFSNSSITDDDVIDGLQAERQYYDLMFFRLHFNKPESFASELHELDNSNYAAIALVRGGTGSTADVDHPIVVRAVAELNTPSIIAIGHAKDKPYLSQVADHSVSTPHSLGTFLNARVVNVDRMLNESQVEAGKQVKAEMESLKKQAVEAIQQKAQIEGQLKIRDADLARLQARLKEMEQSGQPSDQSQPNSLGGYVVCLVVGVIAALVVTYFLL